MANYSLLLARGQIPEPSAQALNLAYEYINYQSSTPNCQIVVENNWNKLLLNGIEIFSSNEIQIQQFPSFLAHEHIIATDDSIIYIRSSVERIPVDLTKIRTANLFLMNVELIGIMDQSNFEPSINQGFNEMLIAINSSLNISFEFGMGMVRNSNIRFNLGQFGKLYIETSNFSGDLYINKMIVNNCRVDDLFVHQCEEAFFSDSQISLIKGEFENFEFLDCVLSENFLSPEGEQTGPNISIKNSHMGDFSIPNRLLDAEWTFEFINVTGIRTFSMPRTCFDFISFQNCPNLTVIEGGTSRSIIKNCPNLTEITQRFHFDYLLASNLANLEKVEFYTGDSCLYVINCPKLSRLDEMRFACVWFVELLTNKTDEDLLEHLMDLEFKAGNININGRFVKINQ